MSTRNILRHDFGMFSLRERKSPCTIWMFSSLHFADGQMEHRSIALLNRSNGVLNHLNYPQRLPSNIDFTQHIIVPLGDVILLEIYNVGISESDCHSANRIEVSILLRMRHTLEPLHVPTPHLHGNVCSKFRI